MDDKMSLEEFLSIIKISKEQYEEHKDDRHLKAAFDAIREGMFVGVTGSDGKLYVFEGNKNVHTKMTFHGTCMGEKTTEPFEIIREGDKPTPVIRSYITFKDLPSDSQPKDCNTPSRS